MNVNEEPIRSLLADAHDTLFATADRDHYCDDEDCSIEKPCCDEMRARRARWLLDKLLTPRAESLHPERLTNPPEREYFERWQRQNERSAGLNHGFTLLEWLLCPSTQKRPDPVSHRDMQVAVAVVQWLGTSCGHGFLIEAEREIRKEQADYRTITNEAFQERNNGVKHPRLEELAALAHRIASRFKSIAKPDYTSFEEVLVVALNRAYQAGKSAAELEGAMRGT